MNIAIENGCPLPSTKLFISRLEELFADDSGELDLAVAYKIILREVE
ncbi:MAG: hypothetical protein ACNYPH_07505 [Gammaproteobacteria bacterium WSBS_2016_MAG_OTU1]